MDTFIAKLANIKDIEYVHPLFEHSWGQRVVRFYDLDKHIIEVGEIYGDPAYYKRFDFIPAETFGIGTPDNMYAEPLQALELWEGALSGCNGRFFVYDVDEDAAAEFDKTFPHKELQNDLPSQERFRYLLGLRRPRE